MLFLGERSAGLLEAMNQANAVVIEKGYNRLTLPVGNMLYQVQAVIV